MNQTYFHGFSSDMDSPEDIWSIPDTITPFMGRRNPQSRTIRRKRERKRALKPQSRTRGRAAAHPLEILLPNGGVKPLGFSHGECQTNIMEEWNMKQLGNLSIVCAKRPDVLMQVYGGRVSVHVGEGPERARMDAAWDDDKMIQLIIRELNFGRYAAPSRGKAA